MAIDDRQINPVDQKTAELLLNRRLNLLQAPRTGGDLDLRTSILDAPRTGLRSLASEQMLQGQNLTGDLDPKLTANLPPEFAFLEKKPSRGRLTDSDFKGIDRASLRDQDLSRTDRRLREIAEEKGQPTQGMQVGPRRTNVAEQFVGGVEETDPMDTSQTQIQEETQQKFSSNKDKLALNSLLAANAQEGNEQDKKLVNEKFIEEYMSAMPEFEGKSKKEKGFDLARLGMAIAAGQSPNAIQNIAKGFLAMGDTFTEDAKEKREYERAIKISAAKYGLESLNRLRVQQDQDKRNITPFKAKEDITLANGNKINKGDVFNLDMAYIAENGIPENALRYDYALEEQKLLDERSALFSETLQNAKDAKVMEDAQLTERVKRFDVASRDVGNASSIVSGVNDIQKDLIESKILFGKEGIKQASKETIKKFFGIKPDEELTRTQWISKLEVLIQKSIPVTLGEAQSANSISDKDVNRLLKGYFAGIGEGKDKFGLDTAFADPESFFNKLEELKSLAIRRRQGALNMMNSIETELEDRTTKSGKRAGIVIDPFLEENFQGDFVRGPDGIFDLAKNIRELESQRQKEIDLLRNPSPQEES